MVFWEVIIQESQKYFANVGLQSKTILILKTNPKCKLIPSANNSNSRLINPANSEIGIARKEYLDSINKIIREKTNVNQWRNTDADVTWFQNIENTDISLFIKFDIVDFYPSISKDLLINAIKFAKSITPIDDNIIKTIVHACFQNLSGPESKKIKKKLCKIFKKRRLNITIEYNLRITDFLDVTFHLRTGKYYPYRKVNNEFYIFTSNQTTDHLSPSKFLP